MIDDQTSPRHRHHGAGGHLQGRHRHRPQRPLFFWRPKYPEQAGMPVTGPTRRPRVGRAALHQHVRRDKGSVNPKYPVDTQIGDFLKAHGGTSSRLGYGISPDSTGGRRHRQVVRARRRQERRARHERAVRQRGLHQRRAGRQGGPRQRAVPALDDNSNYALATALKQAGVKLKAVLFATGYEPSVIHSPAWGTLQGDYFSRLPPLVPARCRDRADAGGAMREVRPLHQVRVPDLHQYEAWVGAPT